MNVTDEHVIQLLLNHLCAIFSGGLKRVDKKRHISDVGVINTLRNV